MSSFLGRTCELGELKRIADSAGFRFVVISGRRRVGKTALVDHLIDGMPAVYFCASRTTARGNLAALGRQIEREKIRLNTGRPLSESPAITEDDYPDFAHAFEAVAELGRERRLVFVLDEFPDLLESCREVGPLLAQMIDGQFAETQVMLVVCGSNLPDMHALTEPNGPLKNLDDVKGNVPKVVREATRIELSPLDFPDAAKLIRESSVGRRPTPETLVQYYGCLGGVPYYLASIDPYRSFANNVKMLFLDAGSALFEEPDDLLAREIRDPATYRALLEALGTGAARLSEVAAYAGMETGNTSLFLKNLIAIGLVAKDEPAIHDAPHRTEYRITDALFRFWFRFVSPNVSIIEAGRGDEVYRRMAGELDAYLQEVFRGICVQWVESHRDRLPIACTEIGRWWGIDALTHQESRVDILAYEDAEGDAGLPKLLCGACIWTPGPLGPEAVDALVEQCETFGLSEKHYLLFSRGGFTSTCRTRAREQGDVRLVALDEML